MHATSLLRSEGQADRAEFRGLLAENQEVFRVALASLLTILAYFSSISPIVEHVLGPRLDQMIAGQEYEKHWYDDYWETYATPWAKACDCSDWYLATIENDAGENLCYIRTLATRSENSPDLAYDLRTGEWQKS